MVEKPRDPKPCSPQTTAQEERLRLARDLHDGLLQLLTGIGLQLEAIQRLSELQSAMARERLTALQHLVLNEQRRLRLYIERLKGAPQSSEITIPNWESRLMKLARQIGQQWELAVEMILKGAVPLATWLSEQVYYLVGEALVNCARHAGATQARVEITIDCERIDITVKDNGGGFDFEGRYDLAELQRLERGPRSLMARVASLRGQLVLDSSVTGSCLEMSVPIRRAANGAPLENGS
jgi:signal transduction histidine kinase